jgi:hypothetical protein
MPNPQNRHPVVHRALIGPHHHVAAVHTHGATHHGGVGAEGDHPAAVDGAGCSQHPRIVVRSDQLDRVDIEQGLQPKVRIAGVLLAWKLDLFGCSGSSRGCRRMRGACGARDSAPLGRCGHLKPPVA